MSKDSLKFNVKYLKKNYTYIALLVILLLAFNLRSYHMDFPAIGYHNMKELDFLGEADNFIESGDWIHPRVYHWKGFEDPGYFEANAQLPFMGWILAVLWMLFGKHVFLGRLVIILFFLGSTALMYFVTKKLTKKEYLALIAAFLFAIMPMGVYFGRNIQPETPGLFFILLGVYFYLSWLEGFDKKMLLYSMLSIAFSALLKATHLIILVPLLFIFPFEKLSKKELKSFLKEQVPYAVGGMLLLIVGVLFIQATYVSDNYGSEASSILPRLGDSFTSKYWNSSYGILKSYVLDNYTGWLFLFAIFGLALSFLKYKTLFSRFMLGSFVSFIIYFVMLPYKLNGHSYYQMPYLPMVSMAVAYFFFFLGDLLKQLSRVEHTKYIPLLILLLIIPSLQASMDRVWDTNFYGQDVAGKYLSNKAVEGERLVNYGFAQSQAVCFYAGMRCGKVSETQKLMEVEEKYGVRFIYVYGPMFGEFQSLPMFDYVSKNYRLAQVGGFLNNQQIVPYYFILEKGGNFSTDVLSGVPAVKATSYTTKKSGTLDFYTIGG